MAAPRRAAGRQGARREEQPNYLGICRDPVSSAAAVFPPPRRRRVRGVLLCQAGRRGGVPREVRRGAVVGVTTPCDRHSPPIAYFVPSLKVRIFETSQNCYSRKQFAPPAPPHFNCPSPPTITLYLT